jgi:hypothetical protein
MVVDTIRIPLSRIASDGTQFLRATVDQAVLTGYMRLIADGIALPAIVLFYDGTDYHIGDGFHRYKAALGLGQPEMLAEVRPGNRLDALWFAMGHSASSLSIDEKRALALRALALWPIKSQRAIAKQLACDKGVINRLVSIYPQLARPEEEGKVRGPYQPSPDRLAKLAEAAALLKAGVTLNEVVRVTHVGRDAVSELRTSLGLGGTLKNKIAVAERHVQMRELAAKGYSSAQIADAVGLKVASCRNVLRDEGITVPADKVIGQRTKHNANRIVEHMVMDAENLCADVDLIDFSRLDHARLPDWLASLKTSRDQLMAFIRRLMKEQQHNGEAA